jgi:hypothetical protein
MSGEPLTPAEAAKVLWDIGNQIDEATTFLIRERSRYTGLVKARRLTFAEAFLTAEGPQDQRRQIAEKAAAAVRFEEEACEQSIESLKDRLRALRDRSEIGRSINSNLKEELRNLGGQP